MKHERTEMIEVRTVRAISRPTAHFRSGKGIWLRVMECPTCKLQKKPLRNLGSDRKYYCSGTTEKIHPLACCWRAKPLACVCTWSFVCPKHGERHHGTHD